MPWTWCTQAKRVRGLWVGLLRQSPEAAASEQPDPAVDFISASFESTGVKMLLRRMLSINRDVHIKVYNRVIREAVKAAEAT